MNHGDERISAASTRVLGDLFKKVRLFMKGLAANLDVHTEVRIKRRVNVDELQPACVLDLSAERTGFKR